MRYSSQAEVFDIMKKTVEEEGIRKQRQVVIMGLLLPWMKEVLDNTSRGGAYLRCPVFTSVHFSLRDEGSSEYIRVCAGREILSPNF
jgi:hypothetical protein